MATRGSLLLAEVQKAIYDWVKKELDGVIPGEQIIWRNQSEPLPPRPCVAMRITDGPRRTGYQDNAQFIGGPTGTQYKIGGQRVMTVSIQTFGNSQIHLPMAYQLAKDLNESLSKMTVLDALRGRGVAVQRQGDPSNLTALEETEYEERAQFDVSFGLADNIVDDPGIIETANITPTVSGP